MKKRILTLGVVLVLVSVLAVPGAVMATNTTVVTGNVVEGYTFTAPPAISLEDMTPGTPKTGNSAGSLTGNNPGGYDVKGVDANTDADSKGHMLIGEPADPTDKLANKLLFGPSADPTATADTLTVFLSPSDPVQDEPVPFYVSQLATVTDTVATGYTITITFTVNLKT